MFGSVFQLHFACGGSWMTIGGSDGVWLSLYPAKTATTPTSAGRSSLGTELAACPSTELGISRDMHEIAPSRDDEEPQQ
jgi:hypothetical protein